MKTFNSVKELFAYIEDVDKQLKGYYARYPVRFIFFYNNSDYQQFIANLNSRKNVKLIKLTEIPPFSINEDSWLTPSNIIEITKNLDSINDTVIFPLSEFLRLFPDNYFISTISSIFEVENSAESQSSRRIYIPLLGLKSRFLDVFWKRYGRQKEGQPCLEVAGKQQKIKIYFPLFEFKKNLPQSITCSKEFLEIWKIEDPPEKMVCNSKVITNMRSFPCSDECFEIESLSNIKEYLEKYFSISIPVEYIPEESNFWDKLIDEFENSKLKNFKELVENFLNLKKIEPKEILNLWYSQKSDFGRWLIKNHFLAYSDSNESYAYKIFESISKYDPISLIKEFWFKIFELNFPQNFADERRLAIKNFYSNTKMEIPFEEELEKKLKYILEKNLNNIDIYLTGVAFCERKFIIENLDLINDVEKIYPELHFYLDTIHIESVPNWVTEYFYEYKISKLKNKPSEKLLKILDYVNESKDRFYNWYYSFSKVERFLSDEKVFLIDALGLEFLPLISNLLKNKGFKVNLNIARANIPTITELNKIEGAEIIRELDNFIHSEYYNYPDTLIKEIEILKGIIESSVLKAERFIITSDHGLTAFAIKNLKGNKMYEFDNVSHEGRCVFLDKDNEFEDKTEFLTHEIEINGKKMLSIVPLKHTSLSEIPRRESHGGATPEEVLIPVIHAFKSEIDKKETFEIIPLSLEVNLREPYFPFKIIPETESVPSVFCLNQRLNTLYHSEKKIYIAECKGLKKGEYKITIKIEEVSKEFIIKIKGGLKERDII